MVPPPKAFRLVYRAFDAFEFDPAKNEEMLSRRAIDFLYVARMFPGYVLERQDTRTTSEVRFQVIGEVFGEVFVIVYTMRDGVCRLITTWEADRFERDLWYDYTR